jgi:hypothetical protein
MDGRNRRLQTITGREPEQFACSVFKLENVTLNWAT